MQGPFRQNAAPPPPPSTDGFEAEFEAQLRSKRRRLAALVVVGLCVVLSPFFVIFYRSVSAGLAHKEFERKYEEAHRLTDAEKRELDAGLATAAAALEKRERTWADRTYASALGDVEPGGGRCHLAPSAPTITAADSYVKYGSIDLYYMGSARYRTVPGGASLGPSSELRSARGKLDDVRTRVATGKADRDDLERVRGLISGRYFEDLQETVVVSTRYKAPSPYGGPGGYEGGELAGRAYLYDHDAERIVCVGDIDAESSESVGVQYMTQGYGAGLGEYDPARTTALKGALERDMEMQIRRAIASELRAVSAAP
jgi:hypothetical protein